MSEYSPDDNSVQARLTRAEAAIDTLRQRIEELEGRNIPYLQLAAPKEAHNGAKKG